MKANQRTSHIKRICIVAMFCAMAFVMTYFKIPVMFLSLEIKDSIIVLCTLLFGPLYGFSIAVIVPLLELITHSTTGVYGLIMNMLSSVTFSLVAGLIYKYKKSFLGAIIALLSGIFSVTAVMVSANLLITPFYMGVTVADVATLIPRVLLPFNLVKATLNGAIALLLYKPLSVVLKRAGFLSGSESVQSKHTVRSLIVTLVSVLVIVVSLAIIFFVIK